MAWVAGIQGVRELLRHNPQRVRTLYMRRGRNDARVQELVGMARDAGVRYASVEPAWLDARVADVQHQGVAADCHELVPASEAEFELRFAAIAQPRLILVLDGVTDPRNLGACLRSANAAGVGTVLLPKRRSAPLSALAMKTAQGGAEPLLIVEVTNLARRLAWLADQGVWLVGAAGEATDTWHQMDASGDMALVLGSEGKGLRRLTRESCDQLVNIPMAGTVDSLNVSVAAGVLLFEAVRQRTG